MGTKNSSGWDSIYLCPAVFCSPACVDRRPGNRRVPSAHGAEGADPICASEDVRATQWVQMVGALTSSSLEREGRTVSDAGSLEAVSAPSSADLGKAGELEHDPVLPPGGKLRLPDQRTRDQGQEVKIP